VHGIATPLPGYTDGRRCNESDDYPASDTDVSVVRVARPVVGAPLKRGSVPDGYDGEVDMSRLYDVCVLVASLLSVVVLMIGA